MALPKPREGQSSGFQIHPWEISQSTIGDPEEVIWSSINHLCATEVAESILLDVYGITNDSIRNTAAGNIKVYINQAFEFYQAAKSSRSTSSPLFYYYSFLNLAKAVCEMKKPMFHKRHENYKHGISWKPNKDYLVNMERECINISTRGVWHELYEAIMGNSYVIPNPTKLKISDLFSFLPEVSIEYEKTYFKPTRLLELREIDSLIDPDTREFWIRFSIEKDVMRDLKLSKPKLLQQITYRGNGYVQVKSSDAELWAFQLERAKNIPNGQNSGLYKLVENEVNQLNIFSYMEFGELVYSIPEQSVLPLKLPQISVLYSLYFWLGSLVRYDPHSVAYLHDSMYWILIDGFLNQSRIWLLELFEWQLFQRETTLITVR